MANYTIELGQLVSSGYPLNLNNYPIYDERHREELNKKIIDHYFFREIGQETPQRFNHYLGAKMNEIMPYYNKLYESEFLEFNPLATEYYKEESSARKTDTRSFGKTNTQATFERATDNYSGNTFDNYSETGNKNKDVNQSHSAENDKYDKLTNDLTRDYHNETSNHAKTTNDLTTNNASKSNGTGKNVTDGNKSTVFSDVPQAKLTTKTVYNADGTISIESGGYATTTNNENTHEVANSETHQDTDGFTTNTGTVDVQTDISVSDQTLDTGTATHDITERNTDNTTTKDNELENKTGNSTKDENSTRNVSTDNRQNATETSNEETLGSADNFITAEGRKNQSPSELIKQYRAIIINIDMMIIEELEELFMEVF